MSDWNQTQPMWFRIVVGAIGAAMIALGAAYAFANYEATQCSQLVQARIQTLQARLPAH